MNDTEFFLGLLREGSKYFNMKGEGYRVSKSVIFLDGPEKNNLMSLPYEKGAISFFKYKGLKGLGKDIAKWPKKITSLGPPKEYRYMVTKIASGYPRGAGLELYGARVQ